MLVVQKPDNNKKRKRDEYKHVVDARKACNEAQGNDGQGTRFARFTSPPGKSIDKYQPCASCLS